MSLTLHMLSLIVLLLLKEPDFQKHNFDVFCHFQDWTGRQAGDNMAAFHIILQPNHIYTLYHKGLQKLHETAVSL